MSGAGIDAWLAEQDEAERARLARLRPGQLHLASMLDELAKRIALGALGDVTDCVVFVRGVKSSAIVTLPKEPVDETLRRLEDAEIYLKTGELPPRVMPWHGCPNCQGDRNPECQEHGNYA